MSNIREFSSSKDRKLQEAADWIAAIERGLTGEEEQELARWLSLSRANYQLFIELAELWDNMEVLSRLSDLFPESQPARRYPSNRVLSVSALAASVVVGIFLFARNLRLLQIATHMTLRLVNTQPISYPTVLPLP